MLTIRYVRAKSSTTRHEYLGLPEKHLDTLHHEPTWIRPTVATVIDWWAEIKKSRGIHPLTGEQLAGAELIENGEYNKTYTTVSYGRIVDIWDPSSPSSISTYVIDTYVPKQPAPAPEESDADEPELVEEGVEINGVLNESSDGPDAGDHQ